MFGIKLKIFLHASIKQQYWPKYICRDEQNNTIMMFSLEWWKRK